MKKKNEIKDELQKLSPFLADLKKEHNFKVPENYFKSLPDKVLDQARVTTKTPEHSPAQPSWLDRLAEYVLFLFQPKYAVGFATVLIVVVASIYFMRGPDNQTDGSFMIASQYVEENIDEFDAEMLWEASVFEDVKTSDDTTIEDDSYDEYFEEIIDDLDDSELEILL